jgi:phosphatidylinositol alpha-1,6-mannosyltransferase
MGRIALVPWPLDHALAERARETPPPNPRPYILTVSRIAREHRFKGHFTIARALPALLARRPDLRWVVVGEGDDLPALRLCCADLGVLEAVVFRQAISDHELADAYAHASMFVLPSVADATAKPPVGEGFGLVYAEAAAFGVPSIAARNSGGAADLVIDGVTGLTVDSQDPAALAQAILRLLEDRELRGRLGETARQRVLARHMPEHFEAAIAELFWGGEPFHVGGSD